MIRLVKLFISIFYYIYIKTKLILANILNLKINPICITLYYHSIYPEENSRFKKQMELVKNKSKVIKSDFFGKLDCRKLYTIITFDDGFENLIENAVPTLKEYNIPFTIFFISNYFNKIPDWEFSHAHRDQKQKIMTIEQMKQLPKDLLTIGSHTNNHRKLNQLNESELWNELIESKNNLEELSGETVVTIAFPNGEYDTNVINKSFEAGYKRVFTIDPDFSLKTHDEKVTARVWANGNDWYPEFWLKVHGGYCWLDYALKLKRNVLEK